MISSIYFTEIKKDVDIATITLFKQNVLYNHSYFTEIQFNFFCSLASEKFEKIGLTLDATSLS